jgi:hypothetical protein
MRLFLFLFFVFSFPSFAAFDAQKQTTLAGIQKEFQCGPSLISPYMGEKGFVKEIQVNYGALTVTRQDLGSPGEVSLNWRDKNNSTCYFTTDAHENFYFSTKDKKFIREIRSATGIYLAAYSLNGGCTDLGWVNVTPMQMQANEFLSGRNSCNSATNFTCADALAMAQRLIRLDLAGDRLETKSNSEIEQDLDFDRYSPAHFRTVTLVLDSQVVACEKKENIFQVTVKHEIYGKQFADLSLKALKEAAKNRLSSEIDTLKIQEKDGQYRVNFEGGYQPHVSLKQLREAKESAGKK